MNDNLDTLSDAELSAVFAVEVAGLRAVPESEYGAPGFWEKVMGPRALVTSGRFTLPPFSTDANAVLPWLEKRDRVEVEFIAGMGLWRVTLFTEDQGSSSFGRTFAIASCVSLIRAKRAEKVAP